ncbi:MAG: hypothetical protein FWD06_08540 [Oscillospiraceae bacterium]|nr:hypothetical protein [Oscillospiraceae bacterium]
MATSGEIIEKLAGKLKVYELFAQAKGFDTEEQVKAELERLFQQAEDQA